MKILVVCNYGINRSYTIASQMKFWGHDVVNVGVSVNSSATVQMLSQWADRIITTEERHKAFVPPPYWDKVQLWDIEDKYPGSYNPALLKRVREFMQQHRKEYKP